MSFFFTQFTVKKKDISLNLCSDYPDFKRCCLRRNAHCHKRGVTHPYSQTGNEVHKFIGLPKLFKICASSATLNLITEDKLPSLIVVKLLFCLSTSTILPTVTSS